MAIEIRKLTPELADDYVRFFDVTPHDKNIKEHKCYCVCWCSDNYEGKDFSTAEKRRAWARDYVITNKLQGYLAYDGNKVVGWCNANTKADCLQCASWRMFMQDVPLTDIRAGQRVKSIFCFVVAPDMKRKGIATRLLKRVCEDAAHEGFETVEAYPYQENGYQSSDFGGYAAMYQNNGFEVLIQTAHGKVMRKALK